jgi:hypothetical protein
MTVIRARPALSATGLRQSLGGTVVLDGVDLSGVDEGACLVPDGSNASP